MASFWSKLKAQLNPFDNGQTWDTVANNKRVGYRQFPQANQGASSAPKVNVQALQQAMTQRKPAAGNSYLNSLKMGVRDIFDANTQADYIRRQAKSGLWESRNQQRDRQRKTEYERELKAAQAKKYRQDLPSKAVNTLTAGTGRGAVGYAQDISGLIDLISPGKGTSDFTKLMASKGKLWDEKAKLAGLNKGAYTVAQAPINIAAFASPGKVAKGIGVGQKGIKIGKTASVSPRLATGALDVVADALQNAGNRTSKGQDNSAATAATDAALSLVTGGLINAGGKIASKGAKKVVKSVDKVAKNLNLKAPTNLKPNELADLEALRAVIGKGDIIDDSVYQKGVAAAKKAGIDYRYNDQIDAVLNAHRNFTPAFRPLNSVGGGILPEPLDNLAARVSTSPDLSTSNVPEPSASSPRSSDLGSSRLDSPSGQSQRALTPQTVEYQLQKNQNTFLANNTPGTREVKLNTSRLNPEGGNSALAEMDRETSEVIQSLSNKDIERLSKNAGIDTRTHTPEQVKQKIAEQLNVRRDAVKYMNEAELARQNGDLENAKILMYKAAEQGRVSRAQGTELAQQLQARRIIANELDTPQQRIFKLLDSLGINPEAYVKRLSTVDFNDPKQVVDAYRDLVPAKGKDWLDVVRYNSMLSSPLTHAVNMASNAINVGVVAPIEKTLRGIADATGGLFGKERKYAAGEGIAYATGAAKNIKKAATDFIDVMRSAQPIDNLDLKEHSIPLATKGVKGAAYNTLSFPMRMLGASDKFFRALAEGGEGAALDLRQSKGIKIKGNIEALKQAEGSYRLFQQDTNLKDQGAILQSIDSITNTILKLRKDHLWAKMVFPFVKTPTNILKQGIEFSPVGYLNAAAGAEDKLTAITRATVGTAVFGMAGAMVGAGDITWSEPKNAEERNRFRSEGKQPYAIRVGGKWISFQKLPPALSFPMALTAGVHDAIKNGKMSEEKGSMIFEAIAKYGEFLSDQSYLKSIGDTLKAFEGDPEKTVQAISNYPQQFVPFRALTGWLARMTDDTERRISTTGEGMAGEIDKQVQSLMQQYPGLRQKTPTRDYKGKPIEANNPVLNAFSPFKVTDDRGVDLLDVEMDALKLATAKDPLLNEKQTKEVDKAVSSRLSTLQKQLINDPAYKNLTPAERKSRLSKIASDLRAVEKQNYMAKNNVGEFSPSYTGKQTKLTKDQKALANGSFNLSSYTKPTKEAGTKTTYAEKYQSLLEESQDPNNGWSNVQKTVKAKELKKLGIQKDYDEDTVSLYGMSKADMYDYITTSNDGKKLADKLIAYDNALFDAGLIKSKKFKTGLAPSKGGRRGGKKGGRRKTAKLKARVPKLATIRVSRPKDVKIKNFKKPSLKVAKLSTKSRGKKVKVKAMTG